MTRAEAAVKALEKRSGALLRLAQAVSFAAVVDRALLRAARLELVPEADAGLEADLWFSNLVQSRTVDGIVLDRDVAEELRARMTTAQAERAWAVTKREHLPWIAPSVWFEEEIAYYSTTKGAASDEVALRLQSVVRAMLRDDRPGLAQWAARALSMFPSGVRTVPAARMLDVGARLRLGRAPELAGEPIPEWIGTMAPALKTRPLVVQMRERQLLLELPRLPFEPSATRRSVPVPSISPVIVDVVTAGEPPKQVTLREGEIAQVDVGAAEVHLRFIDGTACRVGESPVVSDAVQSAIIDHAQELERHGAVFGREADVTELLGGRGIVVIRGMTGVGKTALLCELIRRLAPQPVIAHFFRAGDYLRETVDSASRSLAAQLISRYALEESFLDSPLRDVLARLELSPRRPQRLFIVLDDIDDALTSDRKPVSGIDQLIGRLPSFVTVFATAQLQPESNVTVSTESALVHVLVNPSVSAVARVFGETAALASEGNPAVAEVLREASLVGYGGVEAISLRRLIASVVTETAVDRDFHCIAAARRPLPPQLFFGADSRRAREIAALLSVSDKGIACRNRVVARELQRYVDGATHAYLLERLENFLEMEPVADYFALYAVDHYLAANDVGGAVARCLNVRYMRDVLARYGPAVLRAQLARVVPAAGGGERRQRLEAVVRGVEREYDALLARPDDIDAVLRTYAPELPHEWTLLTAETPPAAQPPLPVRRHSAPVSGCLAWSPSNRVTWSTDGLLFLWRTDEPEPRVVVHPNAIRACVAVQRYVVTGDALGFLRLIDESGAVAASAAAHDDAVLGVAAAAGTALIASWSGDGAVRLWRIVAGSAAFEPHAELLGHTDAITAAEFVGGARLLVTASRDGTVRTWSLDAGAAVQVSRGSGAIVGLAISPDGRWFVSLHEDGTLRRASVEPANASTIPSFEWTTHHRAPRGLRLSRAGDLAVTWGDEGRASLWSVTPDGPFREAGVFSTSLPVACVDFVGRHVLISWLGGDALLVSAGSSPGDAQYLQTAASLVCVADGGQSFITGNSDGSLEEWSFEGIVLRDYGAAPRRVDAVVSAGPRTLVTSDGGRTVLIAGGERKLELRSPRLGRGSGDAAVIWSPADGAYRIGGPAQWSRAEQFLQRLPVPEGRRVLAAAVGHVRDVAVLLFDDGSLRLFDGERFDDVEAVAGREGFSRASVAFAAKDSVALMSVGRAALTWWPRTGSAESVAMDAPVLAVHADAEGRVVAMCGDGTVAAGRMTHGEPFVATQTIEDADPAAPVRFAGGELIVVPTRSGPLLVHDVRADATLHQLGGHTTRVTGLEVIGNVVHACSEDRTLRSWDLRTGAPLGVVYGYNAFRSMTQFDGNVIAGDDAGQLWRFSNAASIENCFISYSLSDETFVRVLDEELQRRGVQAWYAGRDLDPSAPWDARIDDALGRATAMIVVVSGRSRESAWVQKEIELLASRGVATVMVLVDPHVQPFALPRADVIDMTHWQNRYARFIAVGELVERLRGRSSTSGEKR